MPPTQPTATPAPLEDIAAPVAYFPYPWWVVAALVVGLLALLGILVILVLKLRKPKPLTARQKAVQGLERLEREGEGYDAREFAIAASDILRRYLHAAYGLKATTQTSLEFLADIRENPSFNDEERSLLAAFLEQVDLAKYARWDQVARDSLIDAARRMLNRGDATSATKAVSSEGGAS